MRRTALWALCATCVFSTLRASAAIAAPSDVVLYASDARNLHGHWTLVADATAAGGSKLSSSDTAWSASESPLAAPTHYFDFTFTAEANTPYRLWVRLKATANAKSNDSVWAQFSDATANGSPLYRIGTTSGLVVNLAADFEATTLNQWGWTNTVWWLSQVTTVTFATSGSHTLRVQTREDGVQLDQVVLSPSTYATKPPGGVTNDTTIVSKSSSPYSGTPLAVPGTIEAEQFDNGGQGVAYHDVTTGNAGTALRQTDVDLETSAEGGYNVAWISAGEWLKYSVAISTAGAYTLDARIAALGQGGTFHVEVGGVDISGAMTIPNTGGWQQWRTVSKTVTLPAGTHVMRVVFDTSGANAVGNLNWIRLSSTSVGSTPFNGTPFAVPGTIEAERFDNGGAGVAYSDTTAGNAGGVFRQTDVDVESASEGGYDLGWISAGEWVKYSVSVGSAGAYLLEARVAALGQGGTFHVEVGGTNVSGPLTIPNTGGWQKWTTISAGVQLPAGSQVMRVVFDTTGQNAVGNLNWLRLSPATTAPQTPSTPSPVNGAPSAAANPTRLTWAAPGATSYDVRFGTTNPPPPSATGLSAASFTPATTNGTTYFWQVVARNAAGSSTGAVWSFTTEPATTGDKTWTVPAGGNLQAAIDNAQPGDTILLQAGATFTGHFVLRAKGTEAAFITIRSSAPDSQLPGPNSRMHPSYAPLLPKIKSPNGVTPLITAPGAHHYRLMFLEFLPNHQGLSDIIKLGDLTSAQNTLAVVPYELVVDRVYIHGDPVYGQKRGIALNSASTTIKNSYISGIRAAGQDAQAIGGANGPGPYTIENNYLEAAGENILFGGNDPAIPNLVPSDIVIRRNHLAKPLSWRGETKWTVKNLFELKNAQRVVVDGNIMENNWVAAQVGHAVLFTPRNQDGGCPWCVVQDVQFTNNIVRHSGSAIKILGKDYTYPSKETNNIVVRNNFFEDISGAKYGGHGRWIQITEGGRDFTFDHNTVLQDGSSVLYVGSPVRNVVFTNNIAPDNSWAIKGDGWGSGNPTIANLLPNSIIRGNVLAGSSPSIYPTGNHYPASMGAVGFVNYVPLTGGNYRLALTSLYRNAGNDGTDVGVDFDALNAAAGTTY